MNINDRISKARGECRHGKGWVTHKDGPMCKACGKHIYSAPKYDFDPAAWTPELHQWIEDEGLKHSFAMMLADTVSFDKCQHYSNHDGCLNCNEDAVYIPAGCGHSIFTFLSATPAQKAQALARAIEERSYDGK